MLFSARVDGATFMKIALIFLLYKTHPIPSLENPIIFRILESKIDLKTAKISPELAKDFPGTTGLQIGSKTIPYPFPIISLEDLIHFHHNFIQSKPRISRFSRKEIGSSSVLPAKLTAKPSMKVTPLIVLDILV